MADFERIQRLRTVGPFEDWLASPAGTTGGPSIVIARRPIVTRADAGELSAILVAASERARRVDHHHALQCFGTVAGDNGDTQQLLEVLHGTDLARLLRTSASLQAPLEISLAVWIARQLLEVLDHAHSLDVVHGALAPAHVFLSSDGVVKLDFGLGIGTETVGNVHLLASLVDLRYTRADWVGEAPDAVSDVYGCAAILYEMLTGHTPGGIIHSNERPPLRVLRPDAPVELEAKIEAILGGQARTASDAREFELALTEIFYGALDADDDADGSDALSRWVARALPPEANVVLRFAPTASTALNPPKGGAGRFTMALAELDGPVQPQDFRTDDYELPDPTNPDSSWAPGMELRAKLDAKLQGQGTAVTPQATASEDSPTVPPESPQAFVAADVDMPTDIPTAPGEARDVQDTAVVPPPSTSFSPPPPPGGRFIWFLIGFTVTLSAIVIHALIRDLTSW